MQSCWSRAKARSMPTPLKDFPTLLRDGLSINRSDRTGRAFQRLHSLNFQNILDDGHGVFIVFQLLMRHAHFENMSSLDVFATVMAVYVVKRCSGKKRIKHFVARVGNDIRSLSLRLYIDVVTAINPYNDRDRNSLDKVVDLLRLHPIWKDGDPTEPLLQDPFFQTLLSWWLVKMSADHVACRCLFVSACLCLSLPVVACLCLSLYTIYNRR